jgi:hypothetical protein
VAELFIKYTKESDDLGVALTELRDLTPDLGPSGRSADALLAEATVWAPLHYRWVYATALQEDRPSSLTDASDTLLSLVSTVADEVRRESPPGYPPIGELLDEIAATASRMMWLGARVAEAVEGI